MLFGFALEEVLTTNRDHHESVIGLKRYLKLCPEDTFNQGKLKDEQRKLESAVQMLNSAQTNIENVKGPEGSGPLVRHDQMTSLTVL